MKKIKNKIKLFIYISFTTICLIFFINYIIAKTARYGFYNELFTTVVLESIDKNSSLKFVKNNAYGKLDILKHNIKAKHIFSIEYSNETFDILFFSLKDSICVKDRKYFQQSKNKQIQEYLKNECNK